MADELLSSTQTLTPTRTRSRTRAIVGTIAGLALFSGLAFALVRFGIQGDTYTVVEDFEYTNEQLTAFESPLGDHDGSITANAEGQLVLATTPERPEHLTDLPFRENPDISTTRRLPFSDSDLADNVHSICTDNERDIATSFRIGFDDEAIPQGGAVTVLAEADPIDNLGINNLRVRSGTGARNILHQVNWEVYGPGGDVAIQSAPIVEGVPFPRQVSFFSSDPSVAVVYPNGQILPISPGKTRINAYFCDTPSVTSIILTVNETKDEDFTWHAANALDTRFLDGSITSGPLSADLPEGRIIEGVDADIVVNTRDFDLFAEDGTPKGTYTLYLSANGGTNWAGPYDITSQLTPNNNVANVSINFPEGGQGNDLRYALRMTQDETLARIEDSPIWSGVGAAAPTDSPLASLWDMFTTPFAHAQQALEPLAINFADLNGLAALQQGDPNDPLDPESYYFLARTLDVSTSRESFDAVTKQQSIPNLFTRGTFIPKGTTRDIAMFFAPTLSDDLLNDVQPTWQFTGNGANNADQTVTAQQTLTPVAFIPTNFEIDLENADPNALAPFTRNLPTLQVTGATVGFAELSPSVTAGALDTNVNEYADYSAIAPSVRLVTLPETTLNVESISFSARLTPGEVPPADEPGDEPVDPCVAEVEELREQGVPEEDLPLCEPEEIDEELEGDLEIDPRIIHRGESGGGQRVIVKWGYTDAAKQEELVAAAVAGEPLDNYAFAYKSQDGPDALKNVDVYYDAQDEETPFYAVLTGLNGGQTCVDSDLVRCGRGTYLYRITTNGVESDDLTFETLNRLQTIMYDYELIFGDQLRSQGLDVTEIETLEELAAVQNANADLRGRIEGMQFFHDPRNLDADAASTPMSLSGVKFAIMNDRRFNEHSSRLLATEQRRGVARAVEHIYSAVHDRIYVEDLYKICDEVGCAFWADQVTQDNEDRIDLDGVALAVLLSEEYSGVQAAIAADVNKFNADYAYQTVLKRGGDEGGVANLAEQFGQTDDPLTQMRYALALSDEFKNRISTISTDLGRSEAITELYESCFFRASDVEGVAYWSEERGDLTVDELRVNFCEEGEGTGSL